MIWVKDITVIVSGCQETFLSCIAKHFLRRQKQLNSTVHPIWTVSIATNVIGCIWMRCFGPFTIFMIFWSKARGKVGRANSPSHPLLLSPWIPSSPRRHCTYTSQSETMRALLYLSVSMQFCSYAQVRTGHTHTVAFSSLKYRLMSTRMLLCWFVPEDDGICSVAGRLTRWEMFLSASRCRASMRPAPVLMSKHHVATSTRAVASVHVLSCSSSEALRGLLPWVEFGLSAPCKHSSSVAVQFIRLRLIHLNSVCADGQR